MKTEKPKEAIVDVQTSQGIEKLRNLLKDDCKLKNINADNSYLERFLYSGDLNVEAAFNKMKSYHGLIYEYPDWFTKEGPLDKKWIIDKEIRTILPKCDREGRTIYINKLGNMDTNTMKMLDVTAVDDIWIEFLLFSDPSVAQKGVCILVDVENYSWKMMKWLTPENIKISVKKILALPFKDLRLHLVNKSLIIHVAIKIIWPLLPASLKEMIKFHFEDREALYKYIDKSALPPEYGGTYDVNYNELYERLYDKNEEILALFKRYR